MGKEIERKFLVKNFATDTGEFSSKKIKQGYAPTRGLTVRVRIQADDAFLTLKGPTEGISRDEFEYSIPLGDAQALLEKYCTEGQLSKIRYYVPIGPHTLEVDVFQGILAGLIVAEVEIAHADEQVTLPVWVGPEVSEDMFFANANLAKLTPENIPALSRHVATYFEDSAS